MLKGKAVERSEPFERIFNPRTIALVGASDDPKKMGNWCLTSLLESGFSGAVYPINPKRREILGTKTYPSLDHLPEGIDLVIVMVHASAVAGVLAKSADKGAAGAVIISSGFGEVDDPSGSHLQKEIARVAQEKGIRLIGPNTFGMIHTHARLNASFSPALNQVKKGVISMLGQSGGVCHLFMYSAIHEGVGLNKVVGLGNRCDVDFVDLVGYLDRDPLTRALALYMEGLEDPGPLLEKARSVAANTPIVAMKGGRTEAIQKASVAHTGAMTGRYPLYYASFSQFGMVPAEDPLELLDVARALAFLPPPRGDRVAILSGQAGPGILMTDQVIEKGLSLARFEKETLEKLKVPTRNQVIRTNPVDLGFAFTRELFLEAVRTVLHDPNVDAVVIFLADPSDAFKAFFDKDLAQVAQEEEKPLLVTYFTGEQAVSRKVREEMDGKGLLFYPHPSRAVNALAGLVKYARVLKESYPQSRRKAKDGKEMD